jgi:beta-phosphoglucomutase-like phosphatase (HAD superfamily)
MDGVIIDSMPTLAQLGADVIQEVYKLPREEAERAYRMTKGMPFRRQVESCFGSRDGRNVLASTMYELKHALAYQQMKVEPAVEDYMFLLKRRGYKRALVSSTERYIITRDLHQVTALFFDVVKGCDAGMEKLAQIITIASEGYAELDEMVFFGDTHEDRRIAEALDIQFRWVDSPSNLISVVEAVL